MNNINVGAVIVTYNPDLTNLRALIDSLYDQNLSYICIVDNCSEQSKSPCILFNYKSNLSILNLNENFGIAYAQNFGIKYLESLNLDFIIFFDQDSQINNDYMKNIILDYNEISSLEEKIGILGPRFVDERYGFYYKTVNMNKYGIRTKIDVSNIEQPVHSALLISSGSLISVDTIKKVGLMRENYFIDYVDTEWCIRAESMGYKNFISSNATMVHAIGDNVLQFKYFNVPVHSAFRRYYRVRNAYYMLREPHVPTLLALREIFFNFIHQIFLIIFEDDKRGYINSYLRGCIDGIFKYEKNNDN